MTVSGAASCSIAAHSENVASYAGVVSCGPGTLSAANYAFAGGSKGDLSVTARPVTVTADPKSKTYGDADPALTYSITSGTKLASDAFAGGLRAMQAKT